MNRANRLIFKIHRISGTIIAIFFFMWFFTGLVLLYHNFPRLDGRKVLEIESPLAKVNPLPDSLPDNIKSLEVKSSHGQAIVTYATKDSVFVESGDGMPVKEASFELALETAKKWLDAPISRVDTLHERDQWIMYSRYVTELPIYKFYYDDNGGNQLYISSRSGKILQSTDRKSRLWAWFGAIPHKLYIPPIRSDVDRWKMWLLTGGFLCLIASLSGAYVGVYVWVKNRLKTGKWSNPFKKRMMRWHFVLGLIFAIPLITWSLSGIFSKQKVPGWLVPVEGQEYVSYSKLWGSGSLPFDSYTLKYDSIVARYPMARSITWGRLGKIPTCEVVMPDTTVILDARQPTPAFIHIEPEVAKRAVEKLFDEETEIRISLLTDYDNHYFSISGRAPLPVYKISVDKDDKFLFYINPSNGDLTYLNRNRMAKRILSGGLHYLNFSVFSGHPVVWKVSMWILCILGMAFCLTSVWIGAKYAARIFKRK